MQIRLDADHIYWLGDERIPGFSEIAASYFPANPFWTESGREEGQHLHQCCALLAEGDLDWGSVDPRVEPRVRGFEKFLRESQFRPAMDLVEKPQFQPTMRYACTPDWPGYLGSWAVTIEGKRGAKSPLHRLQTAAQKLALNAGGFKAQKRYGLYLREYDYRLEEHGDPGDCIRWAALVSGYHAAKHYRE